MSNLVTISILQSLVIRCLSIFFSIIHHYRILCHNELKFVTHIFQIFRGVNAHLKYGLCKLGLFWFWKIVPNSSQKQLIQIIPNWEIRYNLSFNLFWFICFDFCVKLWSLKMKTRWVITSLSLDTVNHWFLISMVTELYLK